MNWAEILPLAIQALADVEQAVKLGEEIAPEIQTAILLLTSKTNLTSEQRASDLAGLNALQGQLDADAEETE